MVSYDFLWHEPLHGYFLYLVWAPPEKPTKRCEPEEGYMRCSKRFDHGSHSIIFLLFEFSLLLRRFVFRMAEASAKRVTGDEPQGTMGRVQTAGETPARSCVVFLAKSRFLGTAQFLGFLSLGSDQF